MNDNIENADRYLIGYVRELESNPLLTDCWLEVADQLDEVADPELLDILRQCLGRVRDSLPDDLDAELADALVSWSLAEQSLDAECFDGPCPECLWARPDGYELHRFEDGSCVVVEPLGTLRAFGARALAERWVKKSGSPLAA